MADVYPFRGLRYKVEPGTDAGQLMTPPFDTIDAAAQAGYYSRHPHNVIRLELPRAHDDDDADSNRYTRAAATLCQCLERQVLTVEERPAYYLLAEDVTLPDGTAVTRTSFCAAVALSPYGAGRVLPHEQTFAGPIEDRLQLLHHCWTNFSPIFSLYDDVDDRVVAALTAARPDRPALDFSAASGTRQRLWVVDEQKALAHVQGLLAPATLFIADGHHRYETARRFQAEAGVEAAAGPAWRPDRVLMVLTNLYDAGLVVLPTHRVIDARRPVDPQSLLAGLRRWGSVDPVAATTGTGAGRTLSPAAAAQAVERALAAAPAAADGAHAFGIVLPGLPPQLATLRPGPLMAELAPDRSAAWRSLDVAVLHRLILAELLGLEAVAHGPQRTLIYTRDAAKACAAVSGAEAAGAVIMRSTPVASVLAVARAGDTMPQKSTFFYPKFQTGLVMNPLIDPGTLVARLQQAGG